jgi:hypothetical protein
MDRKKAVKYLEFATNYIDDVSDWLAEDPSPSPFPRFPLYGQQWFPWRSDGLGWSSYSTIGGWGCVVTSAAMIVSHATGEPISPRMVNRKMKEVGGFLDGNRFIFSSLPAAYPALYYAGFIRCETMPAPVIQISEHLKSGGYVIAEVDLKLITGGVQQHWLVLTGVASVHPIYGRIFYAHDPWIGCRTLLPEAYCDMGSADGTASRWIFGAAFYGRS